MANHYYDRYKAAVKSMKKRDKNRSFGEQLFPVYASFALGMLAIHLASFSAAVIFPTYHLEVMTGSFGISLLLGLFLVFLFVEIPKWVFIKTVFENYYDDRGNKSYGMALMGALFVATSILSSTFGVPLMFDRFAPEAKLQSIQEIEKDFEVRKQKEIDYWKPQIQGKDNEKKEYFSRNAKYYATEGRTRLSSASSIQGPYKLIMASLSSSESSLNKAIDELDQLKKETRKEAKQANNSAKNINTRKKETASSICFWIMLGLEILYVFGIAFIAYYNDRSEKEQEEQEGQEGNQPTDSDKHTSVQKGKIVQMGDQTEPNQQEQPLVNKIVADSPTKSNPIGFKVHGTVYIPDGGSVPKVWYRTTKGTYTSYSASDLKRMIAKQTGSEDWKNDLQNLADKVDAFSSK